MDKTLWLIFWATLYIGNSMNSRYHSDAGTASAYSERHFRLSLSQRVLF